MRAGMYQARTVSPFGCFKSKASKSVRTAWSAYFVVSLGWKIALRCHSSNDAQPMAAAITVTDAARKTRKDTRMSTLEKRGDSIHAHAGATGPERGHLYSGRMGKPGSRSANRTFSPPGEQR